MNLLNRFWNRHGYISLAIILLFILPSIAFAGTAATSIDHNNIGSILPLWSIIPFAGILLSIALMPLFTPNLWHHHFPKVSAFWSLALAIPFLYFFKGTAVYSIAHIFIADYIPFIILLWALFTVSGGIYIKG